MAEEILTETDHEALLRVARAAVVRATGAEVEGAGHLENEVSPTLKAGAFVSLHLDGHLRGCIGTFDTTQPVVRQVEEMATAAATRDPRFKPVSADEVKSLDIEISVLTPPRPISSLEEIQVGLHGIVISRGYQRGVLLPQVATEYGWDRETFLTHTCRKAGLPDSAWKDPQTVVQIFTAEVFGEH
jgi:AmmeMemoRadiSam system protein A